MGFDPTQAPFDDGSGFSMDDIDPDKPGSGGGQLPEGSYCIGITEVVLKNDKGSTEVKCEVVAAKDQNMIGRTHTEYLRWPKADGSDVGNRIAKEQLLAWCYAAKTTSPEEIKARQQARQGFSAAWLEAMVGRYVLVVVKYDPYTDANGVAKNPSKIDGRVWAIDNPKGKGIPGWVDVAGQQAAAAGTQQTQQPESAQQPAVAAAAAADPFAGLV
jgi:hypothetical protein